MFHRHAMDAGTRRGRRRGGVWFPSPLAPSRRQNVIRRVPDRHVYKQALPQNCVTAWGATVEIRSDGTAACLQESAFVYWLFRVPGCCPTKVRWSHEESSRQAVHSRRWNQSVHRERRLSLGALASVVTAAAASQRDPGRIEYA